jgi:hypothetical protein
MFFPREISGSENQHIHNRRRFMLLGQTLAGMQVWDVRRAIQAIRSIEAFHGSRIEIDADGSIALLALYASLFEPTPIRLSLANLPRTHQDGPDFLNVLRYLDVPQTLAMAAERGDVILARSRADGWEFPVGVARRLKWTTRLKIIERASDQAQSEASGDD